MKTSEVFPSKYVKTSDIEGKGDVVVAITKVSLEEVGDDQKPVAFFKGPTRASSSTARSGIGSATSPATITATHGSACASRPHPSG